MRKKGRIDGNQNTIVKQLRAMGASVQSLASVGNGCPDLLVGFRGINYLFEIKDGRKSPSRRKLTPDEILFAETWKGRVFVINSIDEILKILL